MKLIDNIGLPVVKSFFKTLCEDYDITKLSTVVLTNTDSKKLSTYGACFPPEITKDKLYKIKGYVCADQYKYPVTDKHWVKANGKIYKASWKYDSVEEASVYILCHEFFHFLSWTKQIVDRDGKHIKNLEYNANWFAHGMVAKFSQPLQIM